jgi:hypothetical protein
VDFLVSRSRELSDRDDAARDAGGSNAVPVSGVPLEVDPGNEARRAEADAAEAKHTSGRLKAVNGN